MLWGTLDSYCDTGDVVVGRAVANWGFLSALLRSGLSSEYHFFLGDAHDIGKFRQAYPWIFEDPELKGQVKLFKRLQLLEKLAENDYTVFHQSDFVTYYPGLCYLRNRYAKEPFPITGTTHSLSYQRFMASYLQLLLGGVRPYDSIITTSQAGRESLSNAFDQIGKEVQISHGLDLKFQGRMDHIPLGVDTQSFITRDKVKARSTLEIPQDKVVILSISRFCEYSKADLLPLLRTFRLLTDQVGENSCLLLLAGATSGSHYLETLKKYAEALGIGGLILYRPDFPEEEKSFLFQAADLFVSLSDNPQETFGLSVVEAMASGLPVVVSDFDGYKDLVDHAVNGLKVPTYWGPVVEELSDLAPVAFERSHHLHLAQSIAVDTEWLVCYLKELILHPLFRKQIGEAARQKAQRCYDWRVVLDRYGALWHELKQEALKEGSSAHSRRNPLQLDFYDAFRHYPSHLMEKSWRVEVTDFGRDVYYQRKTQGVYEDLWELISLKVMRHILFLCLQDKEAGSLISRVLEEVSLKQGVPEGKVYYHLLWMLKHHLLRAQMKHSAASDQHLTDR